MTFRVVARLDVKPPHLVKGVRLEGLRQLGDPGKFARSYYDQGIDEIMYQDVVASLYEKNSISSLVTETCRDVFVPLGVGGGIRSVDDAVRLVRAGADKVSLNSAAVRRPSLIREIAETIGTQGTVITIEAKRLDDSWTCWVDSGREPTGLVVAEWAREVEALGAGEIILTAVDADGTMSGPDLALIETVRSCVDIPIVAHGGVGSPDMAVSAYEAGADAVAIAAAFHRGVFSVGEVKQALAANGVEVRW